METKVRRQNLHNKLKEILGSDHVYYQPPSNHKMEYPCIIYVRNTSRTSNADNNVFLKRDAYDVTFIHKDADDDICDKLLEGFSLIRRQTRYKADNLYHDPFYLYF